MENKTKAKNGFLSKNSGITLVAVAITLIILAILITVTVRVAIDHELIGQTEQIAEGYDRQQKRETLLTYLEKLKIKNVENKVRNDKDRLQSLEEINDKDGITIPIEDGQVVIGQGPTTIVDVDGEDFIVDGDLNIVDSIPEENPDVEVKRYYIMHYMEDVNGGYVLERTQMQTATSGTQVTAEILNPTGFSFDSNNPKNKLTGTVLNDGNLQLEVYYSRNEYTAIFVGGTPETVTKKYEAPLGTLPTITKEGYTFEGWYDTYGNKITPDTTMPLEGATYYPRWVTANVEYQTKYYLQNMNQSGYDLVDTVSNTGSVGETVTAEIKSYTGFTYKENISTTTGNIAEDGSTILEVYYTRNSYTVDVNKTSSTGGEVTGAGSYVYEASVTLTATANPGYIFEGWTVTSGNLSLTEEEKKNTSITFDMPANNVTVSAKFVPITYTIHYDGNGATRGSTADSNHTYGVDSTLTPNGYQKQYTVTYQLNGGTGETNQIASCSFAGWATSKDGAVVYADGQTVKTVTTESETTLYAYWNNGSITLPTPTKAGYTFKGWYRNSELTELVGNAGESYVVTNTQTLYARWEASTGTQYTVKYYQENLDNTDPMNKQGYQLVETDVSRVGQTGTEAVITEADKTKYAGFTYNETLSTTKGTIAADGGLVLEVYYSRNTNTQYTVEYYQENLNSTDSSSKANYTKVDTVTRTGKTGDNASITEEDKTKYAGFTYNEALSTTEIEIVGDGSSVLAVYYNRNTTTKYTVEYYQENLDSRDSANIVNYSKVDGDTATRTGKTGDKASITEADKSKYVGFTYNASLSTTELEIAGDGSSVLKVYYSRNTSTQYTIEYYQENLNSTDSSNKANYSKVEGDTATRTGRTGDNASITEEDKTKYAGFNYKEELSITEVEIAGDGSSKLEVYYSRNNETQYKVEYYFENVEQTGYDRNDDATVTKTGKTGSTVVAEVKTFEGFTYNEAADNVLTGTIAGDGSLVLKVYYIRETYTATFIGSEDASGKSATITKRHGEALGTLPTPTKEGYGKEGWQDGEGNKIDENTTMPIGGAVYTAIPNKDTKYTIEYYLENVEQTGYDLQESVTKTGTTDTKVTVTEEDKKIFAGFGFDEDNMNNVLDVTIKGDGSSVLKLYYSRGGATYTTQYYQENLAGNGYDLVKTVTSSGIVGSNVEAVLLPYVGFDEGFEFDEENANNVLTGVVTASNDLILKVYYNRSKDTQYKMEYYLQNLEQTGYDLQESVNQTGRTGETVNITEGDKKTFNGFTFDEDNVNNVLTGTIAGDGSLTLKLYYNRNTNTEYKVTYYKQNVGQTGYDLQETDTVTRTGKTGESVSITAEDKAKYKEFTYNESLSTIAGEIAGDGSLVLAVYYTRNSYTVNVNTTPSDGGQITGAGSYVYEGKVTLTATPNTGYTFSKWEIVSGGVTLSTTTEASTTFTMPATTVTITATFVANNYNVTVPVEPEGAGNIEGTGSKAYGSEVTLIATPNAGYHFSNWEVIDGGVTLSTTTETSTTFTMPANDVEIRAMFEANTYEVTATVDPTGAGRVEGTGIKAYGSEVTLTATANTGYHFSKWEVVSGGVNVSSTTEATTTFTMPNNAVEVKAIFEANTYEVTATVDPTGAGQVTGAGSKTYGSQVSLTATPNTGYTFSKWEVTSGGVTLSSTTTSTTTFAMPANNVEVKAIFVVNSYQVNTNVTPSVGGNVTGGGSKAYGSQVSLTATPNPGYTFSKWEVASGGVTLSSYTEPTTSFTMPANHVTITAIFVVNYNMVTTPVEPDGAGNVTGGGSKAYGSEVTLIATTNTGYHFSKWEVVSGGVSLSNSTEATTTFTMPDNAVEVKAIFEANTYQVTASMTPSTGGSITGTGNYDYGSTVTLTATTKTGYEKTDPIWTVPDGVELSEPEVTTTNGQKVSTVHFTMPADDVNVSVRFTANTYEVTATVNPTGAGQVTGTGSKAYGSQVSLTATPNTGYTFSNWEVTSGGVTLSNSKTATTTFTMPNSNVQVKAVFTAENYTVTASVDPSEKGSITGLGTQTITTTGTENKAYGSTVTLTATPNTGYHFSNWEVVSGGVTLPNPTQTTATFTMPANAVEVKAKLDANTYTITYDGNGATGGNTNSSRHTYDVASKLTANGYTRNGYEFTGWGTSESGPVVYSNEASVTNITSENGATITLYAQWTPVSGVKYTTEYYLQNVNQNGYDKQTVTNTGTTDENVTAEAKTFEGFTFDASNSNNVLSGRITADGNLVLKRYYTRNTHEVTATVDPTGAGQVTGTGSKAYGSTVTLTATANTGYSFSEWQVTSGGVTLSNSKTATTSFTMPDENVLIKAIFTPISYTVTYNYAENGGTGVDTTSASVAYGDSINVTIKAYKDGWEHIGWAEETDSTNVISADKKMPAQNITLYAVYKKEVTATFVDYNGTTKRTTPKSDIMYNNDTEVSIQVPTMGTYTGWAPAYWTTGTSATSTAGRVTLGGTTSISNNTTYYAIYRKDIIATFYDYNGTEQVEKSVKGEATTNAYAIENIDYASIQVPTMNTYTGWTPAYWTTGTSANSEEGKVNLGGSVTITNTIYYYAVYRKDIIATFYDYNGTQKVERLVTGAATTNAYAIETIDYASIQVPTMNTYTGWTPAYWTTGTSADSTTGKVDLGGSVTITNSIDYYAVYTQDITISFNLNGGTGTTPTSQKGTKYRNAYNISNQKAASVTMPTYTGTRTGYKNDKLWCMYTSGAGTAYEQGKTYTFTSTQTLYAKWTINSYTVTYVATPGHLLGEEGYYYQKEVNQIQRTVAYNQSVDLTVTAYLEGWTHIGWAETTNTNEVISSKHMPAGNLTLYAVYKKDVTALFIDYNGTTYGSTSKSATKYMRYAGESNPSIQVPTIGTYPGWAASHWTTGTSADSTAGKVAPGATITLTGYVTYYAVYTQDITISFNLNGGTGTTPSARTGTKYRNAYSINTIKAASITMPTYTGTKSGYLNANIWNTNTSGTGTNYEQGKTYEFSSSGTLYAKWTYNQVTVTYDGVTNGGQGVAYREDGSWDSELVGYYYWPNPALKNLTLTVNVGDKVDLTTYVGAQRNMDGWVFVGWHTNQDATYGIYDPPGLTATQEDVEEGIHLYAIYRKTVTATFIDYNGTAKRTRTITAYLYNNDSTVSITAQTIGTYTGWTASHWTTGTSADSTTGEVLSGGKTNISEDTTFYAVYEQTVSISFNRNGASGTTPTSKVGTKFRNAYNISNEKAASITLPTGSGMSYNNATFSGWKTSSGTTRYTVVGATYSFTSTQTLYAIWNSSVTVYPGGTSYNREVGTTLNVTAPSCRVSFNSNGGSSTSSTTASFSSWTLTNGGSISTTTSSSTVYTFGSKTATLQAKYKVTLPTVTKTNYALEGWYSNSNLSSSYKVGNGGATATLTPNATTQTLYAKWVTAEARIGSTYYATLQQAIDAATANQTVTVCRDIELTETVEVESTKTIRLDLNEQSITRSGGTAFDVSGDLTIISSYSTGEIRVEGGDAIVLHSGSTLSLGELESDWDIQNSYAEFTIYGNYYTIYSDSSNVTIKFRSGALLNPYKDDVCNTYAKNAIRTKNSNYFTTWSQQSNGDYKVRLAKTEFGYYDGNNIWPSLNTHTYTYGKYF